MKKGSLVTCREPWDPYRGIIGVVLRQRLTLFWVYLPETNKEPAREITRSRSQLEVVK